LAQMCIILAQDQHSACLIEGILSYAEDLYEIHKVIMISCGLSLVDQILPVSLLLNYSSN